VDNPLGINEGGAVRWSNESMRRWMVGIKTKQMDDRVLVGGQLLYGMGGGGGWCCRRNHPSGRNEQLGLGGGGGGDQHN